MGQSKLNKEVYDLVSQLEAKQRTLEAHVAKLTKELDKRADETATLQTEIEVLRVENSNKNDTSDTHRSSINFFKSVVYSLKDRIQRNMVIWLILITCVCVTGVTFATYSFIRADQISARISIIGTLAILAYICYLVYKTNQRPDGSPSNGKLKHDESSKLNSTELKVYRFKGDSFAEFYYKSLERKLHLKEVLEIEKLFYEQYLSLVEKEYYDILLNIGHVIYHKEKKYAEKFSENRFIFNDSNISFKNLRLDNERLLNKEELLDFRKIPLSSTSPEIILKCGNKKSQKKTIHLSHELLN